MTNEEPTSGEAGFGAAEGTELGSAHLDPYVELRSITASLGAHLEWLAESGAHGLPRDPEARARAQAIEAELAATAAPEALAAPHHAQVPEPHSAAPRLRVLDDPSPPLSAGGDHPITAPRGQLAPDRAAPNAATRALQALDSAQPRALAQATSPPRSSHQPTSVHPAGTLDELRSAVKECRSCQLCEKRKQTVFARGTPLSRLCFVGEGPGADEDAQGEPFVGKAGQLLDRMIQAMGFSRDEIYVCNVVKCRPPDNRKPTADEMAACSSFLHRQLELVEPEVIVALGATALEGLLGKSAGRITSVRGNWRLYRGKVAVMPTFHPAYLLRTESAKKDVWNDLKLVVEHMGRQLPQKR